MALADITHIDPYKQENEARARRYQVQNQALQHVFDNIAGGLQKGNERRLALAEKDKQFTDRETALANQQGNQLTQTESTNKFTNKQLQETGRAFKQEYFNAVKAYEASDKSDEAKQALEDAKAKAMGSARTIAQTYENIDAQMELFRQAAKSGQISSATDPAVRAFMIDLQDPATPVDKFQIVDDGQGNLKYVGTAGQEVDEQGNPVEGTGYPVDFYLEDIANGNNSFTPTAKVDMPNILTNLAKQIPDAKREVEREWGLARVNDWDQIGEAMSGSLDQMLKDETDFRQIAAELGYDHTKFNDIVAEQGYDFLKGEVKNELMQQLAETTPEVEERLVEYNPVSQESQKVMETKAAIQQEEALQKQQDINATLNRAAANPTENLDYFRNAVIGQKIGNKLIDDASIHKKTGRLVFTSGIGKENAKAVAQFDLNKLADRQRLSEFFGGNRNLYDQADKRNQAYQKQLESNIIDF